MGWQDWVVLSVVALATLYLVRRFWPARRGGCASCCDAANRTCSTCAPVVELRMPAASRPPEPTVGSSAPPSRSS